MGSVYREVIHYACINQRFLGPTVYSLRGRKQYTVGGQKCPWASELALMCPSKEKPNKQTNKQIITTKKQITNKKYKQPKERKKRGCRVVQADVPA